MHTSSSKPCWCFFHQPSSRRRISASHRCPALLTRPPTGSSQRSGAARPRPSASEPAGRPHPDERSGRRHAERGRAEPRLAGLAVHGVPRRRPAQHPLLLLILQPLHHGGRGHAAGLPVSAVPLIRLLMEGGDEVCVCVFSRSHQAGWFPFRVDLQNLRGEPGRAEEAERRQDIQEMVRLFGLCCPTLM